MKNKIAVIGLIHLLLSPVAGNSPHHTNLLHSSSVIHSNINGKTLYVGGNGLNNYTSIQPAIDNASNGDTIFVYDEFFSWLYKFNNNKNNTSSCPSSFSLISR